jgi:membrane peptidoglycan carboxypeptidase
MRKFQEAVLAMVMEFKYPKHDILEIYLAVLLLSCRSMDSKRQRFAGQTV